MRSWSATAALLSITAVTTASLTRIGNITLFSDTTCSDPIFINSWSLGRDLCAKADNSASSPTDAPFRSYIINERPWCDNGSLPYLNIYWDEACAELIQSNSYEPQGPDADETCVVPAGDFKAMAFVCDGFEGAWGSQIAATVISSTVGEPAQTSTVASLELTSTATVSSLPETTSISSTQSLSSNVQATTVASITPSRTNGSATAAPSAAFTGAGSLMRIHIQAIVYGLPLLNVLA